MMNTENLDTQIIGVVNQKGGAGKTTLTLLAANPIAINFGKKVAIIDSDMQGSIIHKRKQDLAEGITEFPYQVFYAKPTEILKTLEAMYGKYDYIFVDMPGQAYGEGLDKLLISLDHAFVPCTEGDTDVNSTFDFLKILTQVKKIKEENEMSMKIHLINNKVDSSNRYKDMVSYFDLIIKQSKGSIEERDENLYLRDRTGYQNLFSTYISGYGKGDYAFDKFINSFYSKINENE